jgi:hypothetical protein
VQMRLTGDCCRQSNTKIIAPLLNIKNNLNHDRPLKTKCINKGIYNIGHVVNDWLLT